MIDIHAYFAALEERHLANLTRSELTRALRALSSCYVERRDQLARGAALEGAGKRAAFALFYGPLHLLTVRAIVRALDIHDKANVTTVCDLGCGTGVGGVAWALEASRPSAILGIDRSAWAVGEANWTYRQFGVRGTAKTGDVLRDFPAARASAVLLAYSVNELAEPARALLLDKVSEAVTRGSALLVVEPIAKRDRGWWSAWSSRLTSMGVVEREWRFPADLPPSLRQIAKSAGLDPRELTARTLSSA